MDRKIKICFLGIYNPLYNRRKVISEGLKDRKIKFYECCLNKNYGSYLNNFLIGNFHLIRKYLKTNQDFTHMIIWGDIAGAYLGRLLSKLGRKTLIFDPITSVYSTMVEERKLLSPSSLKAKLFFLYEKTAYKLSDHLLAPTEEFKKHFSKLFSIKPEKISVLPVGGIVEKPYPEYSRKKEKRFQILYWGGFHPQHGVDYIIRAAKLVEEYDRRILFKLIGKGHCWQESVDLSEKLEVSNISFTGYLPAKTLREEIIQSDIVLGFFGSGPRAGRSIGNKVFEGLAYAKAVITENSKPIRRFFTHKKELYLVEPDNEKQLAEAIIDLYKDPDLRKKIASRGYEKIKKDFSEKQIAAKLLSLIEDL
jgi:glycosyltransferase involved in cell wall biosynthesis